MSKTVTVSDQTGTEALAARLAAIAKPGDVILIKGSLGSKMAYVVEALQDLKSTKKEDVA